MLLKNMILISTAVILTSAIGAMTFANSQTSKVRFNLNATSVPTSEFSGYGPVDRIITIKIKEDKIAKQDRDIVTVKTDITMPFDYDDKLEFKWILTENVHLVKGDLTGTVQFLKANAPKTVEISVTGFSKLENRQIAFQVSGTKNGRRIFADGIITTQKEKTFEDIVQNVEKIRAEKDEN
jgi:hypothetical protein